MSSFDSDAFEKAKQAWRIISSGNAISTLPEDIEKFSYSTGKIEFAPLAVLRPGSQNELCEIIKIASTHKISTHVVSSGKNWGYGSSCPLIDNCIILDLSRMNKILEINTELAYAVIEPGVSPMQLYNYLIDNKIPLRMDNSGAPLNSSLIGNICERGHGFTSYGDRFLRSCAYEVILANGKILKTGFAAFEDSKVAHIHKWGIGPSLDGIFTQSNLGIISKLTIWLLPAENEYGILHIHIDDDESLGELVDCIRNLKLQGVLTDSIHLYNRERIVSSLSNVVGSKNIVAKWSMSVALHGSKNKHSYAINQLKYHLGKYCKIRYYSHNLLRFAKNFSFIFKFLSKIDYNQVEESIDLLLGKPSNSHLKILYQNQNFDPLNTDPARDKIGLYWYAPLLAANKEELNKYLNFIREILRKYNYQENLSLIFFNERCLCSILPILFDRGNLDEAGTALRAYKELVTEGIKLGFVPYRIAPEVKDLVIKDEVTIKTHNLLKHVLDPNHILSPNRYI